MKKKKKLFLSVAKANKRRKVLVYNQLIDLYNAETGGIISSLASCGCSGLREFESNQKFNAWLND